MQTESQPHTEILTSQSDHRLTGFGQAALELHQAAELIRSSLKHGVFESRYLAETTHKIDATVYYLRKQLHLLVRERYGAEAQARVPSMHALQELEAALSLASELEAQDGAIGG